MKNQRLFDTTAMATIALVALSRLIPHWPNFTPVMAIALMGGVLFADRLRSLIVPIAAMILSDLALGVVFGSEYVLHGTQPWVYGSVIAISLFGHAIRSWKPAAVVLGGGTIAAIGFFIVTNFAVWISGTMYPHSIEGLVACYAAGLAFYRDGGNFLLNGILSTWLFASAVTVGVRFASRNQAAQSN
ncbi:MAG: hypothetical protein NTX15_03930 [Candidatus Kapabacteria bacterium]|nr:hypothetical protein [Candidatus Kapabacteria bacterium]